MAEWQTLSQREDQTKGEQEQPFAVIAASLLQRLGRQYTEFVQQVQTHYGVQILPGPEPEIEPPAPPPAESTEPPVTWKTDTVIVATIAELETVEFPVATVTVEEEALRESLPLTTFNFEMGKAEPSGSDFVVKRQPGQAQQWVEDLGNGVTLEMVWIPGGEFWMGSAAGEGDANERPQHRVTVQPFLIGKYPITQNQWKAVSALPKVDLDLDFDPSRFKGANRPFAPLRLRGASVIYSPPRRRGF